MNSKSLLRTILGGIALFLGLYLILQAMTNVPLVFSADFPAELRDFSPGLVRGLVAIQLLVGAVLTAIGAMALKPLVR